MWKTAHTAYKFQTLKVWSPVSRGVTGEGCKWGGGNSKVIDPCSAPLPGLVLMRFTWLWSPCGPFTYDLDLLILVSLFQFRIFCDLIPQFWMQRAARKHKWSPAHDHTMYLYSWLFPTPPWKTPSSKVWEHLAFGREGFLREGAPELPRHQVSSFSRHRAVLTFQNSLIPTSHCPFFPPFIFLPLSHTMTLVAEWTPLIKKGRKTSAALCHHL